VTLHPELIPGAILLFGLPAGATIWWAILELHDHITGRHYGD
jgi:hypothetical protein